jgi:hypothetical protein
MNSKPAIEKDLQWKMFYQHGRLLEQNGIHKGRNHRMKDLQGRRLRKMKMKTGDPSAWSSD